MTPLTQEIIQGAQSVELKQLPAAQWNEFSRILEETTARLIGIRIKSANLIQNVAFAGQYEIVPSIDMQAIINDGTVVASNINKLQTAVAYTQTMEAGTKKSSTPGDFDIIAIEGQLSQTAINAASVRLTAEEKAAVLGVAPLLIYGTVAVVALVVGAIATVSVLDHQTKELDAAITQGQQNLEKKILAKPELIEPYTAFKAATKQKDNLALIDRVFGSGSGQSILSGIGGVLAALGIGYVVFKAMESRGKR